ncbi:hypothetical protein [Flavobacterium orientale]|uniref:Uncharacterized protein n=1 Tax=Flavobacterium orientale TaxID=1756020 RepID=A0A917DC89_9FLAO|nr:hypothetical protein [Flavobacterium orientale]GGD25942.1 hypothetical protein GCM10011343_15090 [Flavobacterium orientale]
MELVGKINIERISTEEYAVIFDIPDNCDFVLEDDSRGSYNIIVTLIPPATSPSSTYNTHIFDSRAYEGNIVISFDQQDYQVNLVDRKVKPVIRIATIE